MSEATLIRRLLAIVERFGSSRGHLRSPDPYTTMGVCTLHYRKVGGEVIPDGTGFRLVNQQFEGSCAKACQEWRRAIEAGRAYLAERDPVQLTLEPTA